MWEGNAAWTGRGLRIDGGLAQGELLGPFVTRLYRAHHCGSLPPAGQKRGQQRHLVPAGATARRRPDGAARPRTPPQPRAPHCPGAAPPSLARKEKCLEESVRRFPEGAGRQGFSHKCQRGQKIK